MNDKAEANLIEIPNDSFSRASDRSGSLTVVQNDATPMAMIAMAVKQGMSLDTIKELRTLQKEYEADEARKAYNVAFAKFKAEVIKVIKGKVYTDGPLKGKAYAELYTVVEAVTPHLSPNGLSASWKLTKDEKDWLEVTCTIRHALGHSESVSMGGPPDTGGAKSPIQARASSVSFLERYTLKAICGVAEQGEDTDGAEPKQEAKPTITDAQKSEWTKQIDDCAELPALSEIGKAITAACQKVNDLETYNSFKTLVSSRRTELRPAK